MPRVLGHMYAAIASVAETIKVEGFFILFFTTVTDRFCCFLFFKVLHCHLREITYGKFGSPYLAEA